MMSPTTTSEAARANNNQQRKKLRAANLCMSLRAIVAQTGSAPFFRCGWR
ncbi:hypothetical Protein YC6258_03545 [Gynuella sunshinyii YC6258]|uniref:Uncharacterized protein n=1 Tax=Gynuella sunshinyii YC6258 TaxID=1445510 RepID=A0A0C5VMP2_9GAMM|nr:hypothetical Protein YC6258_03545 [Gynuella sunshinyii YC6258]